MAEQERPTKLSLSGMPQWVWVLVALGGAGGVGGLGAFGAQSAELAEKADKEDVRRIEAKVDKLADAVTELTIAVRTAHSQP